VGKKEIGEERTGGRGGKRGQGYKKRGIQWSRERRISGKGGEKLSKKLTYGKTKTYLFKKRGRERGR